MDQHTEQILPASPEASGRVMRCPAIGVPAFLTNLASHCGGAGETICLDLSSAAIELDFLSIQALALLARELRRNQRELTLLGCNDNQRKRLRCSGLTQFLTIEPLPVDHGADLNLLIAAVP